MDVIDRANEFADRANADAIARREAQRRAALPKQAMMNEKTGERVCIECYDPIPEARVKAQPHAVRCTSCQEDAERRGEA